ncbi:MAG: HlyD family type I secretion periplasmic adaptor subunit [Rhodobacteraceae bacterium]|nr:HlyD family type I secretion periplasmic adaptor subunit [Paracoccaceae bacterium]
MENFINKFLILVISALLIVTYIWAGNTDLDLVTKGEGRLIVKGKNQSIQVSDPGIISQLFVEEGNEVTQGQVLAVINPTDAEGSLEETRKRIAFHSASITRIDAMMNGATSLELKSRLGSYDPETTLAQIELFEAKTASDEFNKLNFVNRRDQLNIDAQILGLELEAKSELLDSLLSEASEILPLVEKGVIGNSERYRIEREQSNIKAQINSYSAKLDQNNKAKEQLDFEEKSFFQERISEMLTERLDHVSQIEILKTSLPRLEERLKLTEIRAPMDGIVNRIYIKSSNAVVKGGEVLLDLVPRNNALEVEAYIDPKDIGKIEVGQNARIGLTAYDSSKYGYIDGVLTNVSADAVFREDKNTYMFMITTKLNSSLVGSDGKIVPLNAGMIAQVDIIRGKQTLLEYFWQPVAKIKDDAFRQ